MTNVFNASEIYFIIDAQRYSNSSEKGEWANKLDTLLPDEEPVLECYNMMSDEEKDTFNQKVIEECNTLTPYITKLTSTGNIYEMATIFNNIYGEIESTMPEYLKEEE